MLEERQADATFRRLAAMFVTTVGAVVATMVGILVVVIVEWT